MIVTRDNREGDDTIWKPSLLNRMGGLRSILIFCGIGLLVGIVAANAARQEYMDHAANFDVLFLSNIRNLDIDRTQLFFMVLGNRLKDFLLLWVFSITILWQPYSICFCLYQGFMAGFLLMMTTNLYGIKGILLSLSYCMPQYLILLPVTAMVIIRCGYLNRKIYKYSYSKAPSKWKLIQEFLPAFLLFALGIILSCVLEAYINVSIVRKVLTLWS